MHRTTHYAYFAFYSFHYFPQISYNAHIISYKKKNLILKKKMVIYAQIQKR